jgi:small subunit ribosomal protein S18
MDAERNFGSGDDNDGQRMEKGARRFQRRRQRQSLPDYIDWKDADFLKRFVPERGKIMPRRISGISAKDQRRLAKAIKRARAVALLPFVGD